MPPRAVANVACILTLAACTTRAPDTGPTADRPAPTAQNATAEPVPRPEPTLAAPRTPTALAEAEPVVGLAPLSPAQRELLRAGPEDAAIPVEIHYVQSNETRHDLFFPYIDGVGGAFIGVGSDPSFTMMAKAKAELAFMLDIDYRVVDLHRVYAVLIPRSETPASLVAHFDRQNRDATVAVLEEAFADLDERTRRRILRGYRASRETVFRHLHRVLPRARDGRATSWLSDPELYDHVRDLYGKGRVRVMTGDLTGANSLATVAKAARALETPVTVVYFSNAEEYFKYSPQFVENIEGLPSRQDSVVLRTIYSKKWVHADLWAYQVQPLADFKARLSDRKSGKNRSRNPMLRYADHDGMLNRKTGKRGLTLVGFSS